MIFLFTLPLHLILELGFQIVPPVQRRIKPISLPEDFLLKKCIAQPREIIGNTPIVSLKFGNPFCMSLRDYKKLAVEFDHPEMTLEQKEATLWDNITNNSQIPIYGMNNQVSRFPKVCLEYE